MARPPKAIEPTDFAAAVREVIRCRRLATFKSVELAAAAAGVPAQTWYHWENRGVTLAALPSIAETLGCTPAELLPAPPARKAKGKKKTR